MTLDIFCHSKTKISILFSTTAEIFITTAIIENIIATPWILLEITTEIITAPSLRSWSSRTRSWLMTGSWLYLTVGWDNVSHYEIMILVTPYSAETDHPCHCHHCPFHYAKTIIIIIVMTACNHCYCSLLCLDCSSHNYHWNSIQHDYAENTCMPT